MTPRIGSLFSGYGGLDLGVQAVFGGEVVWHCEHDPEDPYQFAARILAHHWPAVPNLGDISAVDWYHVLDECGPVDVLTGGFPCTDLSLAGQRLGLADGTRSGLWRHMARAIAVLRPRLVVIENVRGILSTKAHSGVEPCRCCVDYSGGKPLLRALGAVLGDLAALGLDAEWAGVRAAEIGAPHDRFREFVLAWPADAEGPGLEGLGLRGPAAERAAAAADADLVGGNRPRTARDGRAESTDRRLTAADADRRGLARDAEPASGREPVRQRLRTDADRRGDPSAAHAEGERRNQGRPEPEVRERQPDPGEHSGPDWGLYAPAVARWESIIGRAAPRPTDDGGRLAPVFVEWMMGLDLGHVTAVPAPEGMSAAGLRQAQLKRLGNGVVPLQAAAALRLLVDRVAAERRAAP
ncbi:DNA cytosine methyltransferase [Streptomyces sp. NPDC049577]|uniref:DNA cytosine methyltransferase n=1 Tax=Streptomyces sp. NPDC049577 TaxID=3155153 RepID=UPI00341C63B0